MYEWSQIRWCRANLGLNDVPAYAVLSVTGASIDTDTGEIVYEASQPTGVSDKNAVFHSWLKYTYSYTSASEICDSLITFDRPAVAITDTTPSVGNACGTESGAYTLKIGNAGFKVIAVLDSATKLVIVDTNYA